MDRNPLRRISSAAKLPEWVLGHKFAAVKDGGTLQDSAEPGQTHLEEVDIENATLISSALQPVEGMGSFGHRPLLDLDFDAALLPSSNPGHHHLYLNKTLTTEDYHKLIDVLIDVGIIQKGFGEAGKASAFGTTLRLPWVKKGQDVPLVAVKKVA